MTETVQAPEDAAAARAAEQTRLRKERREAKIKAGGAARLNKITGLGGGIQRDPEPPTTSQTSSTTSPAPPQATAPASTHDDPEEVDISQHYYAPQTAARPPADPQSMSEAQLRQMMLGFEGPPGTNTPPPNPFLNAMAGGGAGMPQMPPGMEGMEEDPMMQMLQKMMAGGGGPPGANPFAGTGMEGVFGGGMPGMEEAAQTVTDKSANVWRIVHAIFALGLGLYVALATSFTGAKHEREAYGAAGELHQELAKSASTFFYLFTSVEALLLTSRYFFDKRRAPPQGILWTISGFLPGSVRGSIRHGLQYWQMASTVRNDALVCVFVLGVCCWLRS